MNVVFEREKMAKFQYLKEQVMPFRPQKPGAVLMAYGKATIPVMAIVKIGFTLAVIQQLNVMVIFEQKLYIYFKMRSFFQNLFRKQYCLIIKEDSILLF